MQLSAIVFRSPPGTLARQLLELNENNKTVQLLVKRRVRLEGAELQEYQKKERQETNKIKSEYVGYEIGTSFVSYSRRAYFVFSHLCSCSLIELSSDSEDDDITNVVKGKHDLMVKSSTQKLQGGFFKSSKKRYPIFPFYEEKIKYDDYGELIR